MGTPAGRILFLLALVVLPAAFLAACGSSSRSDAVRVLVLGDSIITQSTDAFLAFAPPGAAVSVAEGSGSAPCDWVHGYQDPFEQIHKSYRNTLAKVKPRYVVIMFSGNPGLSGPKAGCTDASGPYSASQLISSYRPALVAMAEQASAVHADVYFERPPPRNPTVPVGYDSQTETDWGYQGLPVMALMLRSIAESAPAGDHWIYVEGGAAAVSRSSFTYEASVPCSFLFQRTHCVNDLVPARAGDHDAVHLDQDGCGAALFAVGAEQDLPFGRLTGPALRRGLAKYHSCP
jgi:hypothetical protein